MRLRKTKDRSRSLLDINHVVFYSVLALQIESVDKDYQVKGGIGELDIAIQKNLKLESYYLKKERDERYRSMVALVGPISHLKHDQRMIRNSLSDTSGDQINTLLTVTVYNLKKWMR